MKEACALLLLAALAGTTSAGGGCKRRISCAWFVDPLAPAPDGKAKSPPGSYQNVTGGPACKATSKAGYCEGLDCIYGWNTLDGCPKCGTQSVGCVCVSHAEMRAQNKSTAKVIKVVGWVFLGLMLLFPLTIGWCGVRYLRKHQASNERWIQQYNSAALPQSTSLSVTVPEGMKPGQALHVATPSGAMVAATIPQGVPAGGSFIVTVPSAPPVQVAQPLVVQQGAGLVGAGGGAAQGQQQSGCCNENCCKSKNMQVFWCQGLPAIIFALIAIGCLAGGYNYNLDKYWSNCRNKQ